MYSYSDILDRRSRNEDQSEAKALLADTLYSHMYLQHRTHRYTSTSDTITNSPAFPPAVVLALWDGAADMKTGAAYGAALLFLR